MAALRVRYQNTSKSEKSRILNEFVALTGSHRKHAIRVLQQNALLDGQTASVPGRKIYDEAVCEALVVVWEAADRICGKRLKAILPQFVDAMERHGHLKLNSEVKQRLLSASPATLDRLLRSKREKSKLFERLQAEHPGGFPAGQLRTLQRRVKQWRQLMAKSLISVCLDPREGEQGPLS